MASEAAVRVCVGVGDWGEVKEPCGQSSSTVQESDVVLAIDGGAEVWGLVVIVFAGWHEQH